MQKALELKSDKTTDEIEAEALRRNGLVDVPLPLALGTWDVTALARRLTAPDAVVRSADGDLFICSVAGTDEAGRAVTVDLTGGLA